MAWGLFSLKLHRSLPKALKCEDVLESRRFQLLKSHLLLVLPAVLKGWCASHALAGSWGCEYRPLQLTPEHIWTLCFAQPLGLLSKQGKHYFSFSFLSFSNALFPLSLSTTWSHAFWKADLARGENYKNRKSTSLESLPITQKCLTPAESTWKRYIAKYLFVWQHFKINFPNSTFYSPLGKHLCFVSAGRALLSVTKHAHTNSCLTVLPRILSRERQEERGFPKGSQKVALHRAYWGQLEPVKRPFPVNKC